MIATITLNPCIDLNLEVENFSFTQPLRALGEKRRPGGKGINVSAVLGILGRRSTAVVPLGGPSGQEFLALARERAEFDLEAVSVGGHTRTNIVITARGDGRHLKVNQRGGWISEEEMQSVVRILRGLLKTGDFIVLSGSLPPGVPEDIYADWTAEFRDRGCFVALDADLGAFHAGLMAHPHLIKPNLEELERLAGQSLESETAVLQYARDLVSDCCDICLVSNGAEPAYLVTPGVCLKGFPPEAQGSAVGAGDACLAGVIFELARVADGTEMAVGVLDWRNLSENLLREAFQTGLACGSAAASTPDTEYFPLDLFERCRHNVRLEAL